MTASEHLRELLRRAETDERSWDNDIHGEPLLMALPFLVSLVEAAEAECGAKETDPEKDAAYWAKQKDHPIPGVQRRIDLARALTALTEHLEGQ